MALAGIPLFGLIVICGLSYVSGQPVPDALTDAGLYSAVLVVGYLLARRWRDSRA